MLLRADFKVNVSLHGTIFRLFTLQFQKVGLFIFSPITQNNGIEFLPYWLITCGTVIRSISVKSV